MCPCAQVLLFILSWPEVGQHQDGCGHASRRQVLASAHPRSGHGCGLVDGGRCVMVVGGGSYLATPGCTPMGGGTSATRAPHGWWCGGGGWQGVGGGWLWSTWHLQHCLLAGQGRGDLGGKEWGAEDPTGPLSIHTGGLKYYKMLYVINVLCLGSLNPTTWR